jgi:periplasmic protein TonB
VQHRQHTFNLRHAPPVILAAIVATLVAGCSTPAKAPAPVTSIAPAQGQPQVKAPPSSGADVRVSHASSARAYRADAAAHLYALNQTRIYKGRMPPLLYAIGTLQVEVDSRGNVREMHWMRAPKHAPEVVAEIERTVRAAAPFPAPARMGKVVYTDTWLWHKSGRFQLDTLTEGQD